MIIGYSAHRKLIWWCFYCCITTPHSVSYNKHVVMSMDSVGQEPGQGTTRMTCIHSTMSGPSGRLEWPGQKSSRGFFFFNFNFKILFHFKILFIFWAAPHSLWDLSSPTRDWTWATAVKAPSPNHWTAGEFPRGFFYSRIWCIGWKEPKVGIIVDW